MKEIEKFLKSNGFKINTHSDAYDKGNTRVYFDDKDICVVRFNNMKNQLIEWKNTIDSNMPIEAQKSIILAMYKAK